MKGRTCLSIVLAAGEGTRMRSAEPKVLHRIAGRPLLAHVLDVVRAAGGSGTAVVVGPGPGHDAVAAEARRAIPDAEIFVQMERRGTADAVLTAKAAIGRGADDVVVIFGDTPLIRAQTLQRLRGALADGAAVAVLGFRPADPTGYGRLIMERGELAAIREDKDATPAERSVGLCNGGLMALAGKHALDILERIGDDNSKREFYLTDAVGGGGGGGGGARHQHQGAIGGCGSGAAKASAPGGARRRRDHGRSGYGLSLSRHQARP